MFFRKNAGRRALAALLCALTLLSLTGCDGGKTVSGSSPASSAVPQVSDISSVAEPTPSPDDIVGGGEASKKLVLTSPGASKVTTYESSISLSGSSNPEEPLYLNDEEVLTRSELGFFSLRKELQLGENVFVFRQKKQEKKITVTYRLLILKSVSPEKALKLDGGTTLTVNATARKNAEVQATLNKQTITLTPVLENDDQLNDGTITDFCTYTGAFSIPEATTSSAVSLGNISVTALWNEQSATLKGGAITVNAKSLTPEDSKTHALEFGTLTLGKTGYIAEVARTRIETFDGNLNDDRSRPTNAYLPKGTLDYCSKSESVISDGNSIYKYRLLDYGKRVYSSTKVSGRAAASDFINLYYGRLPATNTLSAAGYDNNGRHSYLILNTQWKAPFDVTLTPQSYTAPYAAIPDYSVSELTYTAIEFKFAYCTAASGSFSLGTDPLFSKAEWKKGSDGIYTLRLTLKKAGGLYGWGASYNEKGQLVLSFLNPYRPQYSADNSYGYSLKGAVIMLDAGHGGSDFGSPGIATSSAYYEDKLNLVLAKKVQSRLTALGATVIMTRTTDVEVTLYARNEMAWNYQPDLFISFHRNGSTSASARGYSNFYYEPYSMPLARTLAEQCTRLMAGNRSKVLNYSPPMQVCRVSDCPAVLTENWFMTNSRDFSAIVTEDFNNQTADAVVRGILNYFLSIQ